MAGVNKIILLGRLGNNPEMSQTQSGMAVCKFSLATSKKRKDGEEVTSWHRCTAFGRTAEAITQYVSTGQQLYVEGELSYGQYEKDGITRYTTDIIVNEISFVGSAKQSDRRQTQQQQNGPQNQQQYPPQQNYNQNNGYDGQPMNQQQMDDSIPF